MAGHKLALAHPFATCGIVEADFKFKVIPNELATVFVVICLQVVAECIETLYGIVFLAGGGGKIIIQCRHFRDALLWQVCEPVVYRYSKVCHGAIKLTRGKCRLLSGKRRKQNNMKVILLFIVPRRYNNIIELTLLQTVFFAILPQKFIFGIKKRIQCLHRWQ